MNEEMTKLRGRLSADEEVIATIRIGIDTDIAELRNMADPYLPPQDIKVDRMTVVMKRLHDEVLRYRAIAAEIARLKSDLGIV